MNNLTNEQIAHDLAVAYTSYSASKSSVDYDVDAFYQEYEQAYEHFKTIVDKNN